MEGWIKLHRQLQDNGLWTCEPFTRGQAWVDLLLLASHTSSFFYVRGIKINLERGQLAWGEVKLSERWKWSRSKLRKFLKDLEKEQQIEQQKGNVIQVITIVNYNEYQSKEQQSIQQKDSKRTAKGQQKDTYKNDKKDNNENKSKMFKLEILDFKDKYPTQLLEEFFNYWSEPNRTKTKMRFEMEKTWDISRRLSTWEKRSDGFKKEETKGSNLSATPIPKDFGVISETAITRQQYLEEKKLNK